MRLSSGTKARPARIAPTVSPKLQRLSEGGHGATVRLVDAHDRAHDLGSARADQAREPQDLSAADLEAHVLEGAVSGKPFNRQHGITDLRVQLGEELVDVAADHVANELRLVVSFRSRVET